MAATCTEGRKIAGDRTQTRYIQSRRTLDAPRFRPPHELPESRHWRFPPASEELNEEVALALDACETHGLEEYTLLLSEGDMLVIDFFIRRDQRTPEGASGKQLLLKIFHARGELSSALPDHEGNDLTYREVKKDAAADYDAG